MSRCFPFPPPGYEKKPIIDEINLLKKEKHKEKKHKKEKKDKEKREGKEKREKDRSGGKHEEKKDRKEKRKDKRKDRDKEKEKSKTSGEKKTAVQAEDYQEEKLNHKDQNDRDKNKTLAENKQMPQLHYHGKEKSFTNNLPVERNDNAKYVQELARRIKDDKGSGSQLANSEQKITVQMERPMFKVAGPMDERKENDLDTRIINRKMDGQVFKQSTRPIGHPMLQNSTGTTSNRLEGTVKPFFGMGLEGKSKPKGMEESQEKKNSSKDRDKKNEEKRESNINAQNKFVGSLNKNLIPGSQKMPTLLMSKDEDRGTLVEVKKRKELQINDLLPSAPNITLHHIKEGFRGAVTEKNLKRRTEVEANGFLHDLVSRPNKMLRPNPCPPLTDDGRKLEPYGPVAVHHNKVDVVNEGHKVNGVIELQPAPRPTIKPSPVIAQTNQITRARIKSPHPDSKYLSQILTVPQMKESLDFDDQEWLFKSNANLSKKPNEASSLAAEANRVWAEALQIESEDICALPYVIPY